VKAAARERIVAGGKLKSEAHAKLARASKGTTRDKVATFTGVKRTTLAKAEAVVEAAESEPDKYNKLVEQMDKTGRVNGPFKRLQNTRAAEQIRKEPPGLPMGGPYRTGIVDYPWSAEDDPHRDHGSWGYFPYPTLPATRAIDVDVPSILAPNASVWLWITNHHLLRGDHLVLAKAWGLRRFVC